MTVSQVNIASINLTLVAKKYGPAIVDLYWTIHSLQLDKQTNKQTNKQPIKQRRPN